MLNAEPLVLEAKLVRIFGLVDEDAAALGGLDVAIAGLRNPALQPLTGER
jgi:hypothetical protein